MGMGALAFAGVMDQAGLTSAHAGAIPDPSVDTPISTRPLSPREPHFPGKAKRVIHLFMNGGPSHVDTFDPKPKLDEYHGKALPYQNPGTERKTGAAYRS